MNKFLFVMSWFIVLTTYAEESVDVALPQNGPLIINLTQNQATAVEQTTVVQQTVVTRLTNYYLQMREQSAALFPLLKKYKTKIMLTVLGTLYVYLYYYLRKGSAFLERTDTWAAWRSELPLEKLLAEPQNKMGDQLIRSIQMRYSNESNPLDSLMPLIEFSREREQEEKYLIKYLRTMKWLRRLFLTKFFPFNDKKIKQAEEAKTRLAYLKGLFASWTANHRITQVIAAVVTANANTTRLRRYHCISHHL